MTAEALHSAAALTIGDVTSRTRVSPATLRMWEQRYGFPRPHRLPSGHRRYSLSDVDTILDVLRRRDAGVRLEVAVSLAVSAASSGPGEEDASSVYAELRRRHPHLAAHTLHKSTMLALSWAIEDEFCSRAERSYLFGGFQRREHLAHAAPRWADLALVSRAAYVFADEPALDPDTAGRLVPVALGEGSPLRREWLIVCDAPGLAVALAAWELPGQEGVPERDRSFESTWSLEPAVVRDAARACAEIACAAGAPGAEATRDALAAAPPPAAADPVLATAMFSRVVSYLDRHRDQV